MNRKLISCKERNPRENGLYFTLDHCSYSSICLFENGKWYILNKTVNDSWFKSFFNKNIDKDIRKDEVVNHDFFWLEEDK